VKSWFRPRQRTAGGAARSQVLADVQTTPSRRVRRQGSRSPVRADAVPEALKPRRSCREFRRFRRRNRTRTGGVPSATVTLPCAGSRDAAAGESFPPSLILLRFALRRGVAWTPRARGRRRGRCPSPLNVETARGASSARGVSRSRLVDQIQVRPGVGIVLCFSVRQPADFSLTARKDSAPMASVRPRAGPAEFRHVEVVGSLLAAKARHGRDQYS